MAKQIQMSNNKNVDEELKTYVREAISKAKESGDRNLLNRARQLRVRMRKFTRNSSLFHSQTRKSPECILKPENNEKLQQLSTEKDSILMEAQSLLVSARSTS